MINCCPASLCDSNPCKNNGWCREYDFDLDYGYYCRCISGYFGVHCEFGKTLPTCMYSYIIQLNYWCRVIGTIYLAAYSLVRLSVHVRLSLFVCQLPFVTWNCGLSATVCVYNESASGGQIGQMGGRVRNCSYMPIYIGLLNQSEDA